MALTGRPPKLTPELQQRIVQRIVTGNYPEVAAGAEGVSRATFYEWMQRGLGTHPDRRSTKALVAFADAVMGAVDKAEAYIVGQLFEFERGMRPSKRVAGRQVKTRITWSQAQAMQWRLSRSRPERWAQRPLTEVNLGMPTLPVEQDAQPERPVIQVLYARDAFEDRDDAPAYFEQGSPQAKRELARLKSDPEYEQAGKTQTLAARHPCPEELGADIATAGRRR